MGGSEKIDFFEMLELEGQDLSPEELKVIEDERKFNEALAFKFPRQVKEIMGND